MNLSGKFIVVDGPDGAGKGTQVEQLKGLIERGGGAWEFAKDPGGTTIGNRIRHILLDFDLSEMDPRCEALLFMASRAQLVAQAVRPALEAGKTVIGDRFISATCAYQVAAGFPRKDVIALGNLAVGDLWPDLTIVLDVPPELGFERIGRAPRPARRGNGGQLDMFGDAGVDAMEARPLSFHERVRELFCELPSVYPGQVVVIDATREADAVFGDIEEALASAFQ